MKKTTLISILFLQIIVSCNLRSDKYWNYEMTRLEKSRSFWTYKNIVNQTELRVLYFNGKHQTDIVCFPNFIIGVTQNLDTIGVVDKEFVGTVNENELLTVNPITWSDDEKLSYRPPFIISPKSKQNDLFCAVKNVYYVSIQK